MFGEKLDELHVVPNCYRIPTPKCYFEMLLFGLAQGPWKCWLLPYKIVQLLFYIFEGCTWRKRYSLICLKEKNEEKLKIFPKYYSFLRFLWIFQNENFDARAAKFADFLGIELIRSKVSIFENRKSSKFYSILFYFLFYSIQ